MQGFNQNTFYEQSYPNNMICAFQKPQIQPNMTSLFLNLQQTVMKQQMLLKLLILQQQQQNVPEPNFRRESNIIIKPTTQAPLNLPLFFNGNAKSVSVKEEALEESKNMLQYAKTNVQESSLFVKREASLDTDTSSPDLLQLCLPSTEVSSAVDESGSDEEDQERNADSKILRRNGFKIQQDNDNEAVCENGPRKSNKAIVPKRPPSKAKHLWINFGRKIIEFAVNNTTEDIQARVKQLIGKLSSKKDFEDVFAVKADDVETDKNFKVLFGKLALFFIKFKADEAFEGSKYREQMITQKSIVAQWVSKLINEQI